MQSPGASRPRLRAALPIALSAAAPIIAVAALLLALSACAATPAEHRSGDGTLSGSGATFTTGQASAAEKWTLPEGGQFDYQLGEPYTPDDSVKIVGRDREDPPATSLYSVCYINAFQTQPGEEAMWGEDLLLTKDGEVLRDPDWPDEVLLDTSTSAKREQILALATPWIEQCAKDGYQAVEFDNLDSYTRSAGLLGFDDNLALAQHLVEAAHAHGLAAAQKNAAQDSAELHAGAHFDFALTESCAYYNECGDYAAVYGSHVLDVEYSDEVTIKEFQDLCQSPDSPNAMVLRDRDLVTPEDASHVFQTCGD